MSSAAGPGDSDSKTRASGRSRQFHQMGNTRRPDFSRHPSRQNVVIERTLWYPRSTQRFVLAPPGSSTVLEVVRRRGPGSVSSVEAAFSPVERDLKPVGRPLPLQGDIPSRSPQ